MIHFWKISWIIKPRACFICFSLRFRQMTQTSVLIRRLSLNKTRTVIGWFLVTCPWSNSNLFRPEYNCTVIARAPNTTAHDCLRESLNIYIKALNVWSLRKLVTFVFPRTRGNCFPRAHTLSVECHQCSTVSNNCLLLPHQKGNLFYTYY